MSGVNSIHEAIRSEDLERVKELIAMGTNLQELDKHRRAPIHLAAWTGNFGILQLLIRSGAIINVKAMDNFTPLHFAVQSNSNSAIDCVKLLIAKERNLLNQRVSKGNKSALHLAVLKGNVAVIEELLKLGIDVNAKTNSGQTALDLTKDVALRKLIQEKMIEVKQRNDSLKSTAKMIISENEVIVTENNQPITKIGNSDILVLTDEIITKELFNPSNNIPDVKDEKQNVTCDNTTIIESIGVVIDILHSTVDIEKHDLNYITETFASFTLI
eukprot:gene8070-10933_t